MSSDLKIEQAYEAARDRYAELGVDTDEALRLLGGVSIALNCWQGDDVVGFEVKAQSASSGGLAVTGGFPGRARTIAELQSDLEMATSLLACPSRLNLHAMYGDFGGKMVERDAILPEHFTGWMDWGAARNIKLDFNSTCFGHPKADSGFTLSSRDTGVRRFWIEHVQRCRAVSAAIGRRQSDPCIHDIWIPDGSKDNPVARWEHRSHLKASLDEILATRFDPAEMKDALEGKLFGIGSECYTVGSHEFYLAYAVAKGLMLCVDMGHYHPTESVADKISAIMQFADELLLHVSRGVRWDSDHVVILNDDVRAVAEEVVRAGLLNRVHFALDYFDASINRVGAWVVGTRATQKAILLALLEPLERLRNYEREENNFARLALLEDAKTLPASAVWDYYCVSAGVPPGNRWIDAVMRYERVVQRKRV
jgi:L-rhamnose isomerase